MLPKWACISAQSWMVYIWGLLTAVTLRTSRATLCLLCNKNWWTQQNDDVTQIKPVLEMAPRVWYNVVWGEKNVHYLSHAVLQMVWLLVYWLTLYNVSIYTIQCVDFRWKASPGPFISRKKMKIGVGFKLKEYCVLRDAEHWEIPSLVRGHKVQEVI